jgi:hypothetical protein
MKAIIAQLIAAAIDADKIPSLDAFDMAERDAGVFVIRLNDGTAIRVSVEIE